LAIHLDGAVRRLPAFVARVVRAYRRRGAGAFARLCLLNAWLVVSGEARRHRYVHDTSFDALHGVDTAGTLAVDEIVDSRAARAGAEGYEPVPPECFSFLLEQTGLDHVSSHVFVDAGSGKGRPVLMAALAGFREAIGIEMGRELHEIACRNITALEQRRGPLAAVSIHGDATLYSFPAAPTVCFLNNPFGAKLLDRLLDTIEASLRQHPRSFTIIYYHCNHADRIERRAGWALSDSGFWRDRSHHYALYRWSQAG